MKAKIEKANITKLFDFYQELKFKKQHLTWDKFAIEANKKFGYDFGESAYRKQIAKYQNNLVKQPQPYESLLKTDIRTQFYIETKKELNKEYKELRKEFVNNEWIKKTIYSMVLPTTSKDDEIEIRDNKLKSVFLIGDNQENGSNWSETIYKEIYKQIKHRIEKENLQEIWLIDLGDGIENFLRISDLALNKDSTVKQLGNYQLATALLLDKLSQIVKVNFGMVLSNHTQLRTMGTKNNELRGHDLTFLVINYLQAYLRNKKNINWLNGFVKNPLDMDYIATNINGYDFFFVHGHDRIYKPNNPKLTFFNVSQYHSDTNIDYLVYGHFHNANFNHLGVNKAKNIDKAVIINGALDPRMNKTNEKSAGLNSKPCFTRLTVDEVFGITNFEKIYLPKKLLK